MQGLLRDLPGVVLFPGSCFAVNLGFGRTEVLPVGASLWHQTPVESTRIKVAALSTSRADYGLMRWVLRAISESPALALDLLAGGAHLAALQGRSIEEIEADGFTISELLPAAPPDDSPHGAVTFATQTALAVSTALGRLRPDWLLVLGDRFEILGPVQAAVLHGIPVCHLCGGDSTEGAVDDSFRHAVSKLAHMHCPSTADAGARLRAMGEPSDRIFITGSPGLDGLRLAPQSSRADLNRALDLQGRPRLIVVTYHPETLSERSPADQIAAVLDALGKSPASEADIVFTAPNIDPGGLPVLRAIESFVASHGNARLRHSLGQTSYFALLRCADAVVGNSSSGLYEAPSFGVPTVNIGDRQKGRLRAESVLDCACDATAIAAAIEVAFDRGRRAVHNPYGDGRSGPRIVEALLQMSKRPRAELLRKPFSHVTIPLDLGSRGMSQ